jgi:hypothetical protein
MSSRGDLLFTLLLAQRERAVHAQKKFDYKGGVKWDNGISPFALRSVVSKNSQGAKEQAHFFLPRFSYLKLGLKNADCVPGSHRACSYKAHKVRDHQLRACVLWPPDGWYPDVAVTGRLSRVCGLAAEDERGLLRQPIP